MIIFRDIISSRSNPLVKWAASLADKKGRNEEKCFLAEGENLTFEALRRGLPVTHICVIEDRADRLLNSLSEFEKDERYAKCKVTVLSESAFLKISTENHYKPEDILK